MGVRVIGFLFLLVLEGSWTYTDARSLETSADESAMQMKYKEPNTEIQVSEVVARNDGLCEFCELIASLAKCYIGLDKTKTEINDALHHACTYFHSLEDECNVLVDFYTPLIFLEITLIQPEIFCNKVHLCNLMIPTSLQQYQLNCAHYAVMQQLKFGLN